jgi:hypothetical protein
MYAVRFLKQTKIKRYGRAVFIYDIYLCYLSMLFIHNSDIYFCCLKNSLNSITDIEYVVESLAAKYNKVKKGLGDVMGGKVLNYEAKDILNKGIKQGLEQGIERGKADGKMQILIDLINDGIISEEQAADRMKITTDEFRKLRNEYVR